MNVNVATEGAPWFVSTPDTVYETEWRSLRTRPCNLLLEGSEAATTAMVLQLRPHLRAPIVWKQRGASLLLPAGEGDTLILQDVASIGPSEQQRLLKWLDEMARPVQIVSTTETPLFPLVARGRFDSALYYRLNVMLLHVHANAAGRVTSH